MSLKRYNCEKMNRPFFSIIIPTKNRSALLPRAINSVLSQDYLDYELIIVDNDDSNDTENVVSTYSDNDIKYYRTGNLSMAENWNYGYSKTTGRYICLIQDKVLMKPGALNELFRVINTYNPESISWKWTEILSETDKGIITGSGNVICYNTATLISQFLNMKHRDYSHLRMHLPRGLNSCIKRELYEKIVEKSGRISMENAPDYTQAYQILFNSKEVYVLDLSLIGRFNRDLKYGTGAQHDLGYLQLAVKGMNSKNTNITTINYQPLEITNTETIVMEDFLRVASEYGLDYSFKDVNCNNYLKTIYRNTLGRQSYAYPDNQDYFADLRVKIKECMSKTCKKGERMDLIVCKLLDVFYYPFHRCGIMTFNFIKRYAPSLAAFMWIVGEKI